MKKLIDEDIIQKFYKENYNDLEILIPKKDYIKNHNFYGLYEKNKLISLVNVKTHYDCIAEISQFVVHKDYRNQGLGKKTYMELETELKEKGFRKILCWIIHDNFASLFRALKLGFLIEGLARDNLPNNKVYLCGKLIV